MEVGKHSQRKGLQAAGEKQLNLKKKSLGTMGAQPTTKTDEAAKSPPE